MDISNCTSSPGRTFTSTQSTTFNAVYLPKTSNPFIPTGGAKMWQKNYLIMHNDDLRKRAGIKVLDMNLTEMYQTTPELNRINHYSL